MTRKNTERLLIRPWPKMVFAWPLALGAFLAGIFGHFFPQSQNWVGGAFLFFMAGNLIVLTFEFGRAATLVLVFALMALVVSFLLANQYWSLIGPLKTWLEGRLWTASIEFYFAFGGVYVLLLGMMFVSTRFDYWEIRPNEVIHHRGILGDSERYPASGIQLSKEIGDVFEYAIGRSGCIVLQIPHRERPIILANVLGVVGVESAAQEILSTQWVRMEEKSDPVSLRRPEQVT